MSITNRPKLNRLVDPGTDLPLVHGDYYRPADRIIDISHAEGFSGDILSEVLTYPSILTGLVVSINASNTTLDITSGMAVGSDSQTVSILEHNYDGLALTGVDLVTGKIHPVDATNGLDVIPRFIKVTSNLLNQSTANVPNGGNGFVKLRFKDESLFTRNTPADPTGTAYSFLTRDSYELIIDQTAPTTADVCLGGFTKDAFGAISSLTFVNRSKSSATQIKNSALDFPNGRRLSFDAATLTADRTYTLQDANMTIASVAQVNAVIPAGSRMLFQQTAAPAGWLKETNAAFDNRALRIVTGAVVGGGANTFTSVLNTLVTTAGGAVANHTLSLAQIPWHDHGGGNHGHGFTGGGGTGGERIIDVTVAGGSWFTWGSAGVTGIGVNGTVFASGAVIGGQGSSGAHNHGFTNPNFNLNVAYHDVIIATKQ